MSTAIAPFDHIARLRRRGRRAERLRLRRQDAVSARLAELTAMGVLLGQAANVVRGGWVQEAWFVVPTAGGGTRALDAYDVGLAAQHPVVGACLVGAVVHAGGGPRVVRSQLVQRTLDLAWHTLREDPGLPVRWCPSPPVRTWRLLDLTRWNDAAHRTQDDVVGLLVAARGTTEVQRTICRVEQGRLAAAVSC